MLFVSGCGESPSGNPLEQLYSSGELIVLTRNAPTTYYEGREGQWEGFEYDLVNAFAHSLNLEPRYVVLDSTAEILAAIRQGKGHIAAAGLTRTAEREAFYTFGPDYLQVKQLVVCNNMTPPPRTYEDLGERAISVIANSSYEERLYKLQSQYPNINWTATFEDETEQIMDRVWQGDVDCTVADSNIVEINRRYFPELKVGLHLGESQSLAWVIAPEYVALQAELQQWFAKNEQRWLLEDLKERYFGYVEIFDYVDIKRYNKRMQDRLPKYEVLFRQAQERFGIPWTLLAAQAYQESHWDAKAISPTGVRGVMMLTLHTSRQMGVIDRLDPEQSILGGARYLRDIFDRLPDTIEEPDRTWIALACYNVGFGHVMDARELARREDLNPDAWIDLMQVLPKLSQPKYYKTLKHGYARGREPVRYVQRIRDFKDILERRINDHTYEAVSR